MEANILFSRQKCFLFVEIKRCRYLVYIRIREYEFTSFLKRNLSIVKDLNEGIRKCNAIFDSYSRLLGETSIFCGNESKWNVFISFIEFNSSAI